MSAEASVLFLTHKKVNLGTRRCFFEGARWENGGLSGFSLRGILELCSLRMAPRCSKSRRSSGCAEGCEWALWWRAAWCWHFSTPWRYGGGGGVGGCRQTERGRLLVFGVTLGLLKDLRGPSWPLNKAVRIIHDPLALRAKEKDERKIKSGRQKKKKACLSHNDLENLGEVNLAVKLKFWITDHCEVWDKTGLTLISTAWRSPDYKHKEPTVRIYNSRPAQQNTAIKAKSGSLFFCKHPASWLPSVLTK